MNLFKIPEEYREDVMKLAVMTKDRSSVLIEVEELYSSLHQRVSDRIQDERLNAWLDSQELEFDTLVNSAIGNFKAAICLDSWITGCRIEAKRKEA